MFGTGASPGGGAALADMVASEGGIPPLLALLNGVNIPAQVRR